MSTAIRYSEAFKKQVVEEIARGKFSLMRRVQIAYSIKGCGTVAKWIRKYDREDLLPKRIRIETMEEIDQLKKAKKRIKKFEAALVDAWSRKIVGYDGGDTLETEGCLGALNKAAKELAKGSLPVHHSD